MSSTPTTVYADRHYRLDVDPATAVLSFDWLPDHVEMDFAAFQEACSNFVGYGFEYGATGFLIDVRAFRLTLPPEFPAWQRDEHYPRYLKLGVRRVAYVMPAAFVASAKTGSAAELGFELQNFTDLAEASAWLAAA